jgi:hypothetical protein
MATQGQYQSFSLIAYNAFRMQTVYSNSEAAKGCDCRDCNEDIYFTKHLIDTLFNYSIGCLSVPDVQESTYVKLTDYIKEKLQFTTDPIGQLAETTLNNV